MSKTGHTDRTLHIGIKTDQWDELRDRARDEGISIATLARKALRLYVNPSRNQTQHILWDIPTGRPKKQPPEINTPNPSQRTHKTRTRPNAFSPEAIAQGLKTGTVINKLKETTQWNHPSSNNSPSRSATYRKRSGTSRNSSPRSRKAKDATLTTQCTTQSESGPIRMTRTEINQPNHELAGDPT